MGIYRGFNPGHMGIYRGFTLDIWEYIGPYGPYGPIWAHGLERAVRKYRQVRKTNNCLGKNEQVCQKMTNI